MLCEGAEQSLEDFETCCLAEIFLPNVESYEELVDLTKLLYRINKHSLRLPSHHPETEAIVHKNMRMGIGITGYLQCSEEKKGWLSECYKELRKYDKLYSEVKGWPVSIKLTTVKPSGTVSLLPGVTPGVHPGYAHYMIRRIRVASNSPLIDVCIKHGYKVEPLVQFDGSIDRSTMVVEFPFSYPENAAIAKNTSAIEQLEYVRRLQTEWSDNSVSCTVYFRPEELPTIKEYLAQNYNENFKTLSFLLHSGHGFAQAPYEEISKELWEQMTANSTIITSVNGDINFEADDECATGVCPIK